MFLLNYFYSIQRLQCTIWKVYFLFLWTLYYITEIRYIRSEFKNVWKSLFQNILPLNKNIFLSFVWRSGSRCTAREVNLKSWRELWQADETKIESTTFLYIFIDHFFKQITNTLLDLTYFYCCLSKLKKSFKFEFIYQ